MKKSDRHQLSAVIHHFLYRTYELPLSWYGMTVPGLSQADITCLHGTCRTVLFAADRLMIAGDLPVLDARPFNDRVVHLSDIMEKLRKSILILLMLLKTQIVNQVVLGVIIQIFS